MPRYRFDNMNDHKCENIDFSITFCYYFPYDENKLPLDMIKEFSNDDLVVQIDTLCKNIDGTYSVFVTFSDTINMNIDDLDTLDIEYAIVDYTNAKINGANIDPRDDTIEFDISINNRNLYDTSSSLV